MSKALEETMKRLERTSISDMRNTGATSPSLASTLSAASPVHHSDMQANQPNKDGVLSPGSAHSASPVNGGYNNSPGTLAFSSDQARIDSDALGKNRARRAVQSMYGAPPGYNASIGVGGSYNSLGRGRVSSGRQRNSIMVPDQLQAALTPQNALPANQLQPPVTRLTGAEYALMANMPDDAIPNAIVVKNITFTIKREDLLQTMADLSLPMPYAFNYHFDNGVFRGLAFGNFRTPEEAARVIIGLNGVSLLGRPLKVEYKKTLPGTVPPPHPNTIAMMNSSNLNHQSVGDMQIQQQQQDIFGGSSAMSFGQN
ncbi:Peptidyl-prolyl cis-trans isomerase pin4, partial [Kickxella alabastrina]